MLERSTYTWFGIFVHDLFLGIFVYDIIPSDTFVYDGCRIYDDFSQCRCIGILSYTFIPNTTNYISFSWKITYSTNVENQLNGKSYLSLTNGTTFPMLFFLISHISHYMTNSKPIPLRSRTRS